MGNTQSKVIERLDSVKAYRIPFDGKMLDLIEELQKMPRAGKHLRMDKNNIILPKRSVYDHLISLGRNADVFKDFMGLDFDTGIMADNIAFHDLAEAMIGDTPFFATSDLAKSIYRSKEHKDEEEKKANVCIAATFDGNLKADFDKYLLTLENPDRSYEQRLFGYFDRVDPIINIWKYISIFRTEIDIGRFLSAMDDFFINPNVISYSFDDKSASIVRFFQKGYAERFYHDGIDHLKEDMIKSGLEPGLLISLLSEKNMHFVGKGG